MTEYKRFDETVWLKFGQALLPPQEEKGSEKQKEFLELCKSGKTSLLSYIDDHLLSHEDSIIGNDLIVFEYRFTEREFLYPPKDTQRHLWNIFREVPDEITSCCGFWGHTIIDMIKGDYIKPEYLASDLNGVTKTGVYVIDTALKSGDDKKIDDCVRRILRSMCNPAPRGKRILFNDFYLGKAYWRWHWSQKMSEVESIDLGFDQILEILNESYYGEFSAKMHTGKSYIGSENVLGGLLLYLKQANKKKITNEQLRKIIDKISFLSVWKAIEIQEPTLNQKEIQQISKNIEKLLESEEDA